jgi:glycosyltransferase involved in cell wall biosynthesis
LIKASKIKIAFFTGSFQYGGTERYLLNLLKNIDRQLFHPTVMCFYKSGELLPEIQRLNINIEVFPIKNSLFNITAVKSLINATYFMKQNDIQIVHTLADWANFFGVFAAKLAGIKNIIVSQRNMGHWITRKSYYYVNKILYKYIANGILVNAYSIKKHLTNKYGILPSKIEVIHNGISFNNRSIEGSIENINNDKIIVGFVGRLHPIKGFSFLIDAAKQVIKKYNNIEFLIVGDGPEKETIKMNLNNYGIADYFKFVGYKKNIIFYINKMDFIVVPSKSEGFPNVVLEAMACQKPVLATRVGEVPEIVIDGETGIIVEPGDIHAMVIGINKLCGDDKLRKKMGLNAYNRAQQFFGIERMIQEHIKYYLEKSGHLWHD